MRLVTGDTSFCLDRGMLKGKRSCFVGVAIEADHVLRGRGAQLPRLEAAMRVVAVAAGQQPFIHLVVIRLGKIGLYFLMAAIAQGRLRLFQELPFYLGRVDGVAVHAAYVVLQVLGAQEIAVFLAEFMTGEAAPGGFFP